MPHYHNRQPQPSTLGSGPSGPSLGFTIDAMRHGYLGHYANFPYLREGHNRRPMSTDLGARKTGLGVARDAGRAGLGAARGAGRAGLGAARGAGRAGLGAARGAGRAGLGAARGAGRAGLGVAKKAGGLAKKTASFFNPSSGGFLGGIFGGGGRPEKAPRGTLARIHQRAEGIRAPGSGFENPRVKRAFIRGTKAVLKARQVGRAAVSFQKARGVKEARHEARVSARESGASFSGIRRAGRQAAREQREANRPLVKATRTAARADIMARQLARTAAIGQAKLKRAGTATPRGRRIAKRYGL